MVTVNRSSQDLVEFGLETRSVVGEVSQQCGFWMWLVGSWEGVAWRLKAPRDKHVIASQQGCEAWGILHVRRPLQGGVGQDRFSFCTNVHYISNSKVFAQGTANPQLHPKKRNRFHLQCLSSCPESPASLATRPRSGPTSWSARKYTKARTPMRL